MFNFICPVILLLLLLSPLMFSLGFLSTPIIREITDFTCTSTRACQRESEPAPGPYSVCVKNATSNLGGVCWCDVAFYYDYNSLEFNKCVQRLGDECRRCEHLGLPWECSSTARCACDAGAGFTYNEELKECVPLASDLFEPCSRTSDCQHVGNGTEVICELYSGVVGHCICDRETHLLGSKSLNCILIPESLGGQCEFDTNCESMLNSECAENEEAEEAWGTCECSEGYEPNEEQNACHLLVTTSTEQTLTSTEEPTTHYTTSQQEATMATTIETETPTAYVPSSTSATTVPLPTSSESPSTPNETTGTLPTETTTTTSTSTTTTTTPTPPPSTAECTGIDQFGVSWHAFGGQTARHPCPGRETGWATWQCDPSGVFVTQQPNFSDCVTEWVGALSANIEEAIQNGSLNLEMASTFFGQVDSLVSDAIQSALLNPTENGPNQFFGHEINKILDLTGSLVSGTSDEDADVSGFEENTNKALRVSESLIGFQKPWEQLSPSERTDTFDHTVQFMEKSAFNLAGHVRDDTEGYSKSYGAKESAYLLSVGIPDDTAGGEVGFDGDKENLGSSILLPGNWREAAPGGNTSFVGMQIDKDFVKANVGGKVFTGHDVDAARGMNSKMMAFTLGAQGHHVDFGGDEVEVKHKLEQPSWSTEPKKLRRRLHPGEQPSSVGTTQSCSFFNQTKKMWSTEGCRMVSDGPYQTTCKCNHLSSFAMLSQFHEYAGKGLAHQITSVAGPTLPALGHIRTLYTAPPHPLRWRQDFHKFLMLFFIVGNFAMVALIDKHYFYLGDGVCYAVGLGCHLFFLVCFAFILVLSMDVYMTLDLSRVKLRPLLVKLIRRALDWRLTIYVIVGIVMPVLVVTITAVVGLLVQNSRAYGGEFCWLDGTYIWAFYVPALFIFIINCAAILYFKFRVVLPDDETSSEARHILSTNLLYSFLLFLSWFAAFYQTTPYLTDSPFLDFVFPLLNGVQGLALYLMCRSAAMDPKTQQEEASGGDIFKSVASNVSGDDGPDNSNDGGQVRRRNTGQAPVIEGNAENNDVTTPVPAILESGKRNSTAKRLVSRAMSVISNNNNDINSESVV